MSTKNKYYFLLSCTGARNELHAYLISFAFLIAFLIIFIFFFFYVISLYFAIFEFEISSHQHYVSRQRLSFSVQFIKIRRNVIWIFDSNLTPGNLSGEPHFKRVVRLPF